MTQKELDEAFGINTYFSDYVMVPMDDQIGHIAENSEEKGELPDIIDDDDVSIASTMIMEDTYQDETDQTEFGKVFFLKHFVYT